MQNNQISCFIIEKPLWFCRVQVFDLFFQKLYILLNVGFRLLFRGFQIKYKNVSFSTSFYHRNVKKKVLFKLIFIKFCQFKSIDHLINDESQIKLCWLILSKNFSVIPIFNYTRVLLNRSCTDNQFVSSNTCTIILIFTYVSYRPTCNYSKIDFVIPKCVCSHTVYCL